MSVHTDCHVCTEARVSAICAFMGASAHGAFAITYALTNARQRTCVYYRVCIYYRIVLWMRAHARAGYAVQRAPRAHSSESFIQLLCFNLCINIVKTLYCRAYIRAAKNTGIFLQ